MGIPSVPARTGFSHTKFGRFVTRSGEQNLFNKPAAETGPEPAEMGPSDSVGNEKSARVNELYRSISHHAEQTAFHGTDNSSVVTPQLKELKSLIPKDSKQPGYVKIKDLHASAGKRVSNATKIHAENLALTKSATSFSKTGRIHLSDALDLQHRHLANLNAVGTPKARFNDLEKPAVIAEHIAVAREISEHKGVVKSVIQQVADHGTGDLVSAHGALETLKSFVPHVSEPTLHHLETDLHSAAKAMHATTGEDLAYVMQLIGNNRGRHLTPNTLVRNKVRIEKNINRFEQFEQAHGPLPGFEANQSALHRAQFNEIFPPQSRPSTRSGRGGAAGTQPGGMSRPRQPAQTQARPLSPLRDRSPAATPLTSPSFAAAATHDNPFATMHDRDEMFSTTSRISNESARPSESHADARLAATEENLGRLRTGAAPLHASDSRESLAG